MSFPAITYRTEAPTHRYDAINLKPKTNIYRFIFFFHLFFLIAYFCLFCRKGKSSVLTGQPFLFVAPACHHNLLCWESLLILWCQDNSPSAYPPLYTISTSTMSSPPPPRPPVAAETLAILVVGVNYILPLKQRVLLPPDAKRTARMCCCLDQI